MPTVDDRRFVGIIYLACSYISVKLGIGGAEIVPGLGRASLYELLPAHISITVVFSTPLILDK